MQRKSIPLDKNGTPVDRSREPLEAVTRASGGILIEAAPDSGVEVSFDNSNDRYPITPGRKFVRPFTRILFWHGAEFTGAVSFIVFDCGEDVDDSSRRVASADAGTNILYDVALDLAEPNMYSGAAFADGSMPGSGYGAGYGVEGVQGKWPIAKSGTGATAWGVRQGRKALKLTSGNGLAAPSAICGQSFSASPLLEQPDAGTGEHFHNAWRMRALLCLDAVPSGPADGDCGLFFTSNAETAIGNWFPARRNTGFGLSFTTGGGMEVVTKLVQDVTANTGWSYNKPVLAAADAQRFHLAEMRLHGARAGRDAFVEFYLDGKLVDKLTWGTDPLPAYGIAGKSNTFLCNVINHSTIATPVGTYPAMWCASWRVQAAATMDQILAVS